MNSNMNRFFKTKFFFFKSNVDFLKVTKSCPWIINNDDGNDNNNNNNNNNKRWFFLRHFKNVI